ncbi:phospholipid:diacylglycerol acyltransferase [Artomyces pyxidatus]|uniref:Phospholipid:diacylglycerol acyltransferase n=1 Tax=Artomyces pyxidatus TaxID=48021 RepID=A0ACB8SYC9_9AGAM|nr:phospholipid:diacylglycerol acyltransferase [Artomyces pyxidatus]
MRHRFYATRRFLFPLGILLGLFIGVMFIEPSDLQEVPAQLALILNEYDFSLSLPALPQFDLSRVEVEWKRLLSQIPEPWKLNNDGREFQVGDAMKARGLTADHPVILVPGIISTGLESWSTTPEYRAFFRQKLWGGFHMISQVTFNREKWMSALLLDPVTGLDPPGVKVRAAEGIDAASSFIQGYWIWSKVIENLAVVNYDTNNMILAPYDWRLSTYNLEERDGYFSKLKGTIESLNFKWVESPEHGGGGPDWVENHVEALVSIAGTHLGVAKAMAALLSGEMKDTVQMNPAGEYVLERFFSKKERQRLFRSWAGSASMWIKGGAAVWGNTTHAPDDEPGHDHTHGDLIAFRDSSPVQTDDLDDTPPFMEEEKRHSAAASAFTKADAFPTSDSMPKNMTADDAGAWILEHTPVAFQKMIASNYSFGIERDEAALERNDRDHTKWTNPLEIRLPNAPSMNLYCVYGHGKETEQLTNFHRYASGPYEYDDSYTPISGAATCTNETECTGTSVRSPLDMPLSRRSWIDKDYTDESTVPKVRNGVKMGEGDGTVSLLSLGAMCAEGWKRKRWNPAGIRIVTVELPHQPVATMPRGGANTSDHVDILGSTGLNEIILKVATGVGHEVQDNYVSRIREYAKRIRWDG